MYRVKQPRLIKPFWEIGITDPQTGLFRWTGDKLQCWTKEEAECIASYEFNYYRNVVVRIIEEKL